MARAIDVMKLRKDTLPPSDNKQLGLLLQIIQNEHPSVDRAMSPIGQTSLHRLHPLHFSSSTLNGDLSSNLAHDMPLSISKALFGQALIHAKQFIISIYLSFRV
jgi:hypothetical protein